MAYLKYILSSFIVSIWCCISRCNAFELTQRETVIVDKIQSIISNHLNTRGESKKSAFVSLFQGLRKRSSSNESIQRITITIIDRLEQRQPTYTQLCTTRRTVCSFIDLNGFFTIWDKIEYIASSIRLMQSFDTRLDRPTKLISIIQQLSITQIPDIRGRAWFTRMEINLPAIRTRQEFLEVMAHELWHIIDLSVLVGRSQTLHTWFTRFGTISFTIDDPSLIFYQISRTDETTKKSDHNDADFVSTYAMTDPFEDFAETWTAYIYHHDAFVIMKQNSRTLQLKYDYMKLLTNDSYMTGSTSRFVRRLEQDPLRRPSDVTRR